jgi:hypothetical protein
LPEDPFAVVPQDLAGKDSREYEQRVVAELRRVLIGGTGGVVEFDGIELRGSRPDTAIVFHYHHRPQYVGRNPALVAGPRAEIARLCEFALDPGDWGPTGLMEAPVRLAAALGSAFDAAS